MRQRAGLIAVILVVLPSLIWAVSANDRLTEQEQRGKRIYLRGESASGRPITATLGNDGVELPASTLPCANCHGADGKGKPEGGVIPSELTWDALTKPYGHSHPAGRQHPAFTAQSLERAIVEGVDPAGNKFSPAMPKYQMTRADMDDLIAYLRRVADDCDPGITATTITVGTLLPESGLMTETAQAMREVLQAYFADLNQQGGIYHRRIVLKVSTPEQAQQFLASEAIFALVGAMTAGAEQDLTALINREEVPLLGPFTLYPQQSTPPDRHTFYVLGGLPEQAQVLVKAAAQRTNPATTKAALIVLEDARAKALATAIEAQGKQRGWSLIKRYAYARGQLQADSFIHQLRQDGIEVIFFAGASGDENALLEAAAKRKYAPLFYLPGALASRDTLTRLAEAQPNIYLSYPTLPTDQAQTARAEFRAFLARHHIKPHHFAAQLSAYVAARLLVEGLQRAGRAVTREKLINALEGLYEFDTGLTPRLTFGPNRRIGAFGAYIVTFDRDKKEWVPAGSWISLSP